MYTGLRFIRTQLKGCISFAKERACKHSKDLTVSVCSFAHMNCLNAWTRSVRLENLAYVFEILVKFSICYQFRYTFTYVAICCFDYYCLILLQVIFCEAKSSK